MTLLDDALPHSALSNGLAAVAEHPTAPPVWRLTPRVERIDLEGDYAGLWVELVMNPPMKVVRQLQGDTLWATLATLIRAWNFVDADGQPVSLDAAGLDELPPAACQAIAKAWTDAQTLPLAADGK